MLQVLALSRSSLRGDSVDDDMSHHTAPTPQWAGEPPTIPENRSVKPSSERRSISRCHTVPGALATVRPSPGRLHPFWSPAAARAVAKDGPPPPLSRARRMLQKLSHPFSRQRHSDPLSSLTVRPQVPSVPPGVGSPCPHHGSRSPSMHTSTNTHEGPGVDDVFRSPCLGALVTRARQRQIRAPTARPGAGCCIRRPSARCTSTHSV